MVKPCPEVTESEARMLVTNNHCCQIYACPFTNFTVLYYLSHKSASKLHLFNSARAIEFWKSSNEVSCDYSSQ